jgi:hypothetical protein
LIGEIGCRSWQRQLNDWVEVQEGHYRCLGIADDGEVRIKIVIGEYPNGAESSLLDPAPLPAPSAGH